MHVREVFEAGALGRALAEHGAIDDPADVVAVSGAPVGAGQLADSYRIELTLREGARGLRSVFVQLPASDAHSAATAARIGAYQRELRFYQDLLPRLEIRTPRLVGTLPVGGDSPGLVLEDLSDVARPLDQLRDGTIGEVDAALSELVGLQAPVWNDTE